MGSSVIGVVSQAVNEVINEITIASSVIGVGSRAANGVVVQRSVNWVVHRILKG